MRTQTILIATIMAAAVTFGVFGHNARTIGRDVARDGQAVDVSGSLDYRDDEWFVDTDEGSYQLMMGRYGHEKDLPLADGAAAEVRGFSIPDYIAPMTLATGGELEGFWHEARYPLWAGSGERRNAVSEPRAERVDDARGLALDRKPLDGRDDAPRTQAREHVRSRAEIERDEEETFERARRDRAPSRGSRR